MQTDEPTQPTQKDRPDNVFVRYRGYIIIGAIFFISGAYLYYVFNVLEAATKLTCVEEGGEVLLNPFGFGPVSVLCKALSLNEVGDYIAGLVSLLATAWLVVAFVWQAMELAFQRKEFLISNAIAKSRASSEDIWRRLELHELFRKKLGRTVNETLTLKAKIGNEKTPEVVTAVSDLRNFATLNKALYQTNDYDIEYHHDIERLNSLILANKQIVDALDDLEADEQLKDYLGLFG